MTNKYHIGKIVNTHGIKGEVKIYSTSDFNRFFAGQSVYLIKNHQRVDLLVENVRPHKNLLIVKFEKYSNINEILAFKGFDLFADDILEEELDENDYHYSNLIGKKAYTDQDVYIGVVTACIEVPQGHLLEIKSEDKKVLIPFISHFVGEIDDEKIIIHPIEGLL
jgi:16S rRNA processing protein RimM